VRIVDVETICLREPEHRENGRMWVTNPLDVFEPELRGGYPSQLVTNVIARVVTDDGLDGLGTVGVGSVASKAVIDHHLKPLLVGEDPFAVERLWERMFRATLNIGRKGLVLESISALDIALWDIMGKATGQPVYNLLGGRTKNRIRAYVSQNYAREDLGLVRDEAAGYMERGFTALKMRFGYGPRDGEAGKRKNYELVAAVREAIGPDVDLMADAYMGWDVSYAVDMIHRLEDLRLRWVEEPIVPDNIDGYVRIRASVRTPIAAGEHEFTRWGYRELLQRGAVDVLQPDVNRMGGITEARKVFALASAFDVPVIPHSSQSHNAHLIGASLNAPLIEYFPRDTIRTGYMFCHEFFDGEPEVQDGFIALPEEPGLGIRLNEEVVERYRVSADELAAG